MRPGKIVLGIVAATFVVVAGGVIYGVTTFDAAAVKAKAIALVKEKKQRTLRLDGDVSLTFYPRLGLRLSKVGLSERGSDREFASVGEAAVAVQLLPLLNRELVVDRINLDGVQANLVRHADGRFNFDDLLSPEKNDDQSLQFDLAGISLKRSGLTVRDEASHTDAALSDVDLETGRIANAASGSIRLAAHLAASRPATKADLVLSGDYRFDLAAKDYELAKIDAKLAGLVAGIAGSDLRATAGRVAMDAGKQQLAVESLVLTAQGKRDGGQFGARVEAPRLALGGGRIEGTAVDVGANLASGEREVRIQASLAGFTGGADALNVRRMTLMADAKQGAAAVKARLESPLAVDQQAGRLEVPNLAGTVEISNPAMPARALVIALVASATVDYRNGKASSRVSTRFDETQAQADLRFPRLSPLQTVFDLNIDRLDLDRYLPVGVAPKPPTGAPVDSPVDLKLLEGLDLSGSARIGALQVARIKMSKLRFDLRARDGRLELNPLGLALYGGTANGDLTADSHGNEVTLHQKLVGVDTNPLLKDAIDKDLIEGRGDLGLDLAAHGQTVAAMKKTLSGSARIALRDGAIKGINLAQSFREAKALISARQDAVQQARMADKTDFTELTASFRIADGVAHNDDLAAKSPFLRLAGSGDIDVPAGRIDYLAKATVVNTSGGQGGKELGQVAGLTVPVRISGPFDRLSYRLEFANLIGEVAKAKVEEQKQVLQQKAQEAVKQQLGDKLKGLLR